MSRTSRAFGVGVLLGVGLAACGGGGESPVASLRLALPIDMYDTRAADPASFGWTHSGVQALEVAGSQSAAPHRRLHGLITTEERGNSTYPPEAFLKRAILHDDAVFGIHGERFLAKRWGELPASVGMAATNP
ncbi:MAG: hypothetical protein WDO68_13805 [Gammaproteobacteria bacterium]